MKLLTAAQRIQLIANAINVGAGVQADPFPVVKLFTPDGAATWLLTELDPADGDTAFGLCDLGVGCPELGTVRLTELATVRSRTGLPVERDLWFTANKPLSAYATRARLFERIVT